MQHLYSVFLKFCIFTAKSIKNTGVPSKLFLIIQKLMAGIYIHVPFCKTRCIYCDFYSTTQSSLQPNYVSALCKELVQRKEYLDSESVETIYFGGGTPSQLSYEELTAIFQTITENYRVTENAEVTMEANPDDLSSTYLSLLRKLPFNRISMGIQTFHDGTLKLLKRRHSALQALEAFKKSRVAGFNNISIDLMYGLPGESIQTWKEDINKAISLSPEHISAYHLTYEQGTPIYNMLQQHKIREVTEELSVTFFNILREELLKSGYEHYEISNFCRPGKESKHNTSYWKGVNYLGCGPSAHSFNGKSREWNVSSLNDYIKGIEKGERDFETEELNADTRYNELIITSLRTSKGICLDQITQIFGGAYTDYCLKMGTKYMEQESLIIESGYLRLTEKGLFISDGIMSTLLKVEN